MNSLILYLGTFYIFVGIIFLTVPIIYLELGKPKDLIKAFLNLLIGLILIIKYKTTSIVVNKREITENGSSTILFFIINIKPINKLKKAFIKSFGLPSSR